MPPRWVVALAAVAFDPDVGQKIEALCPANALTEEERRAVAFASLPDSVSALDGGVLVGAAAQATSSAAKPAARRFVLEATLFSSKVPRMR